MSGMPASTLPPSSSNASSIITSTPISSRNPSNTNTNSNNTNASAGNGVTTPVAGSFRPKPIEELLMPSSLDKKKTPPSVPPTSHHQTPSNDHKSSHAFNKTDPNVKNAIASSWSSLASGSPQSTPASSKPKPTMDSFQQFRNKAKEKADRQKLIEQQEMKQRHKEAAEKRQQEQKKREEIDRYVTDFFIIFRILIISYGMKLMIHFCVKPEAGNP